MNSGERTKPCFIYIPNYISLDAQHLLSKLLKEPESHSLSHRRLINFGGVPHPRYFSTFRILSLRSGTISQPLPEFLNAITECLVADGVTESKCDQALVNFYESSGGIGYHKDGDLFQERAAILSLGSSTLLHFRDISNLESNYNPVLLEPGSLFVFYGKAYNDLEHSIHTAPIESFELLSNDSLLGDPTLLNAKCVKKGRRISVTLRKLAKVTKSLVKGDFVDDELRLEIERRERWWNSSISEK